MHTLYIQLGRLLVALCAASIVAASASAAPLLTSDFDSDGASDFTVVRIGQDGALSWRAFGASAEIELGTLGRAGNHLILGHWMSPSGPPQIGVVRPDAGSGKIEWVIRDEAGTEIRRQHGASSDLVVSGADFDGNGLADGAVISRSAKGLVWKIAPDLFGPSAGAKSVKQITFGSAGDTPFFSSPRGAADWLALVKPGPGRERTVVFRNSKTGKSRSYRLRRSVTFSERPLPVALPNGRDLLAFVNRSGGNTNVLFKNVKGRTVARAILPGAGTVVSGDFLPAWPGEEIAVQSAGGFSLFNPKARQSAALSAPDGIPVDEININSFSVDGDPSPLPGECRRLNPRDGNEGFLWKPNSDTQFFAVTLLPSAYTGSARAVETRTRDGRTINVLTGKGAGNGNRTSWQDFRLTGADYRRLYGSIVVHATLAKGECLEYVIDDPSRRID